jgi:hypothetical protein
VLVDGLRGESIKSDSFLDSTVLRLYFWMLVDESGYPIHFQWRIIATLLE